MSHLDIGKESEPYDLFVFADQTREKYVTRLKKFFEIIGIDQEMKLSIQERCKIFTGKARAENEWLTCVIIRFLQFQKGRVSRNEITGSTTTSFGA